MLAQMLMAVAGHAEVGLNARTAQMLIGVAAHPVLANACSARILPAGDYTTLYQLSRLPEPELRATTSHGPVEVRHGDFRAVLADLRATSPTGPSVCVAPGSKCES